MCHSRAMNNKINRLHERSLDILQSDKTSSFEKLLEKDGSVNIHARNLLLRRKCLTSTRICPYQ